MVREYISLVLLVILVGFATCKKNDNESSQIQFNGITETDDNGNPVGTVDSTDWTVDKNWNDTEHGLFSKRFENCNITVNSTFNAYPNPANDALTLTLSGINTQEFTETSFRIVDRNYNILGWWDTEQFALKYVINLAQWDLPDDTVRVYYKFYGENCELRGHGDIAKRHWE